MSRWFLVLLFLASACPSPSGPDAGPPPCREGERDCGGGVCTTRTCPPVLMSNEALRPCAVAVDATGVYVVDGRPTEGATSRILRVPVSFGPAEVFADGLFRPGGLALDDTFAVWSLYDNDGGVFRKAKAGGDPEVVAPQQRFPRRILSSSADGGTLVWVNRTGGELMRWRSGALETLVENAATPTDVETFDNTLLVASTGLRSLLRLRSRDGGYDTLARWQCSKLVGCVAELAVSPSGIAVAVEQGGAEGEIWWVPHDGGMSTLLANHQRDPGDVIIADEAVVWVNAGTAASSYSDGQVLRLPLDGGPLQVLADQQLRPCGVASYGSRIYWTNSLSSELWEKDVAGE